MSSPQSPQTATPPSPETSQAAQVALALLVSAALAKLWPNVLTPASLPAFKAAVTQEVRQHAQASAALSVRQYRRQRTAAGETSTFRTSLATLPSVEDVGAMVDTALREAGVQLDAPATPESGNALADAKARLATAAEDTVFDTGVRTILENAGRDRAARGYARIPEPNACAFCLMLATRGAVYKATRSRGRGDSFAASNAKFQDGALPASIKVHDNCRCHPQPVFGVYEAPARVREAEATYIAASKAGGGRKAVAIRFRQMVEGRHHPDE